MVWAWPGKAGSRRPGEEPVFQHIPLSAYRCVDSNDRWQWLYRGHHSYILMTFPLEQQTKKQTEFSLMQRRI